MTGLTLAQEIRKYDPRGFIIFVTTHSEMSYMTFIYKLEALDFILKDEPKELPKIILHCKNRQMEFLGKIKEIEKEVDGRFYRCHRSFLVNKDNIREIDFQHRVIYMVNGDECLISSRMMKGLK